jgi:hypothetical protein
MSLFESAQWNLGKFIKLNAEYGVLTYLIIAIIITYYQNSMLKKDRLCSDYLWINTPQMIILLLGLFSAISALYLTGWADSLIEAGSRLVESSE